MKLHMSSNGQCQRNVMEIYDGTTSEDDKYGVFCDSKVTDYSSLTNRLYLRLRGSRLSEKPIFSGRYTVFKPGRATSSSYLGDDNRLLSIEIGGFTLFGQPLFSLLLVETDSFEDMSFTPFASIVFIQHLESIF